MKVKDKIKYAWDFKNGKLFEKEKMLKLMNSVRKDNLLQQYQAKIMSYHSQSEMYLIQ